MGLFRPRITVRWLMVSVVAMSLVIEIAVMLQRRSKYLRMADGWREIATAAKDAYPYNARAWLWATCPEGKLRDGKRAVESATRACELNEWKSPYSLGALAAAYADSGNFDKAVEWQEKAHKLYSDEEKKTWQKLLDTYRQKKPYRDTQ